MAKIYGELEKAQIENVAADPALGVTGRVVINTTDKKVKIDDGDSVRAVVTEDKAAVVTNKDIDGGTMTDTNRLAVPKGTTSGLAALTDKEALLAYDTDKKLLQTNDGSGWTDAGASGLGGLYVVTQDDFEFNVDNVTTTDAVNLVITHETTSPIQGAGSLKIAKAASNESGDYVKLASFTIDDDLQAQVLSVRFTSTQTTNYVDEYLVPVAYDVENSAEIAIIPEGMLAGTGEFRGTFQTAVKGGGGSEGQYEIRLKVDTTTTTAWDVFIDRFDVSKQEISRGTVVTEWKDVTLSWSGTGGTTTSKYRRVGDSAEFQVRILMTGAGGGSMSRLVLTGFAPDTDKLASGASGLYNTLGNAFFRDDGTAARNGLVSFDGLSGSDAEVRIQADTDTTSNSITPTSPWTWAANDEINLHFFLPVAGWGADVVLGEDADTRTVFVDVEKITTSQTISSGSWTQVTFNSEIEDSHAAFSSNQFTAPFTSNYFMSWAANCFTSGTAPSFVVAGLSIDGANDPQLFRDTNNDIVTSESKVLKGSGVVKLTKGQTIQLRCFVPTNSIDLSSNNDVRRATYLNIASIQSGQQIAASEKVIEIWNSSSGQPIESGSETVDYSTKDKSTHSAVTTGASWLFTSPKSTTYQVSAMATLTNSSAWADTENANIFLRKNGSTYFYKRWIAESSGASKLVSLDFSTAVYMNKGDTLDVQINNSSGATINLEAGSQYNRLSIVSID